MRPSLTQQDRDRESMKACPTLYEGRKQSTPRAMVWHTCSSSAPTSSWKVNVSACWKVAHSFRPWGPVPRVPTHTYGREQHSVKSNTPPYHTKTDAHAN